MYLDCIYTFIRQYSSQRTFHIIHRYMSRYLSVILGIHEFSRQRYLEMVKSLQLYSFAESRHRGLADTALPCQLPNCHIHNLLGIPNNIIAYFLSSFENNPSYSVFYTLSLIIFLVKFVFIFVADFKSIFMSFTTLPFFSHPVKPMYFHLKLIYQIKTEYLEPLSRYSVLYDFLLYKYLFVLFTMCNISCYVYTACRCV